ncbi:MAG TPA: DUF6174 domain-containing protein [Cellvibrio sp.]|nr:DUF6174 domain-containing protein [Cellvibrio sp.]
MKVKSIACALSLLLLSACGGNSANNPDAKADKDPQGKDTLTATSSSALSSSSASATNNEYKKTLQSQRDKWSQRNIHSYQFVFRMSCFCLPEMTQKKQVTVADDLVKEAFFLESSSYLTQEELTRVKTIDELFDLIDYTINSNPYQLNIRYNSEYGYPEVISVDKNKNMVDDEFTYYASDLM